MIEIRHLYKSFEDKEVLHDINATFENGKTNLIIGQSGSGKTVLMKNIVGLLDPTRGEVLYDGRDFVAMSKREKVLLRREMGMIFQGAALFDSLTVQENVQFPLDMFSNMTSRERAKRAQECLERVNLLDARSKYPDEISGGMQKRVAIARSWAMDPELLLMDEPTAGLDNYNRRNLLPLIDNMRILFKTSIIIITHDLMIAKELNCNLVFLYNKTLTEPHSFDYWQTADNAISRELFRDLRTSG